MTAPKPPNMSDAERTALNAAMAQAAHYQEWGMGASTRDAAGHPNIRSITSVDSDPVWVAKMQAELGERAHLIHGDIGPVRDWGYPVVDVSGAPYVAAAWDGPAPDLILIDGRFRVACALFVLLAAPTATIMLHDADRPCYDVLREFFTVAERIGVLWRLTPLYRPGAVLVEMLEHLEDAR